MRTTISVPDDVFDSIDRLAIRDRRSRSEVYSAALREYVARHSPDEITDALNMVVADVGGTIEPFVDEASLRILESTEW